MINLYEVSWFSIVDWYSHRYQLLAESEDQIKNWINNWLGGCYQPQYRLRNEEDSLKITLITENISFPILITNNLD